MVDEERRRRKVRGLSGPGHVSVAHRAALTLHDLAIDPTYAIRCMRACMVPHNLIRFV